MFASSVITLIIISIFLEIYLYFNFKKFIKNKFFLILNVILFALVLANLGYNMVFFDRNVGQTQTTMWSVGLFMLFGFPRLILLVFFLIQDIFRGFGWLFNRTTNHQTSENTYLPSRRKFVMISGLAVAAVPFFSLIYGMTLGKYNFKVIKKKLVFDRLPKSFDGFKILHITDIHSGSLDNREKIEYAIDLINEQEFDILLFTGDIVNNFYWEMDKWYDVFSKIKKAPYGNFAVLGNHDYGEYSDWKSEEDKQENFEKIKAIFPKIGMELLLNENRFIEKNGEKISLVGVQNWGTRFKKLGDIDKASVGVDFRDFKILMSHDPSHWDEIVKKDKKHYDLTLSGHTHGMQLGIEVPSIGFRWSPAQYVYPQWAGFYAYEGRIINVNRGFGYHFYPGRVGVWPEITVIELKSTMV
ncbi:MAG: metallophosphoesterase [Algoriella sp.]|nr:metallophosphoesterase [Algoriella sp.]MBO6212702.1 metallophosphoesterase [Algoriella sp.]